MSVTVPEGLSELLEEFAVAVLREKPADLTEFAVRYFTELHMSRKSEGQEEGRRAGEQQPMVSAPTELASTAEVEMDAEAGGREPLVRVHAHTRTNLYLVGAILRQRQYCAHACVDLTLTLVAIHRNTHTHQIITGEGSSREIVSTQALTLSSCTLKQLERIVATSELCKVKVCHCLQCFYIMSSLVTIHSKAAQ